MSLFDVITASLFRHSQCEMITSLLRQNASFWRSNDVIERKKKLVKISADWHPYRNTYHKNSNYNCTVFIMVATMCGSPKGIRTHSTRQWKALGTVLLHWRHSAKNRHASAENRSSQQPWLISVPTNRWRALLMNAKMYNAFKSMCTDLHRLFCLMLVRNYRP